MKIKFADLMTFIDHREFRELDKSDCYIGEHIIPREAIGQEIEISKSYHDNDGDYCSEDTDIYPSFSLCFADFPKDLYTITEEDRKIDCGEYTMIFSGGVFNVGCQTFDTKEATKIVNFMLDCLGYNPIK